MYEAQNNNIIRQRMLDAITTNVNKTEGYLTYDIASPVANEVEKQYMELDSMLLKTFGQTSYDEWLDKKCAEFGITRKPGVKATGTLKFTGVADTVIPVGFAAQTQAGLQYTTLEQCAIGVDGTVSVDAEAADIGPGHNVIINTIIVIPVALTGVTSVTNEAAFTSGSGIELDNDLRARLLSKVQTPPASGNLNDYNQWALEIAGVGAVKVIPVWHGAGSVKVLLLDTNKQPASQVIVDAVADNIDEKRPVGATVTTVAATPLAINIIATISLDSGYTLAQVKANIEKDLIQLFKDMAFKKYAVSYTNIGAVIFNAEGVNDYTLLTLNGNYNSTITVQQTEVAILGTVTLS